MVIVVRGDLDVATAPEFREAAERLAAAGNASRLVIDLRGLGFMDSSGLRALIAARDSAEVAGRDFAVVQGPRQVQRLMRITRVGERLNLLDDFPPPSD